MLPETRRHPKGDPPLQEESKKTVPEELEKIALKNINKFPVCLMLQDEARFGRMSDPGRCWIPVPHRPKIMKALVREYIYIFGAVCPKTGHIDYMEWSHLT
ncbi:MAG: hypothetical protein LBP22_06650 [Deltaproteobacteria bacterium]|nr:hypothetical protein [Deltaproteobacteria bacterium]